MVETKPTIEEKVRKTFKGREDQIFRRQEIIKMVLEKYPSTNKLSVIPSDYCYNITNNGIKFHFHLFEWQSKGVYKCLGENFNYEGLIYWKGLKYGKWKNGKPQKFNQT